MEYLSVNYRIKFINPCSQDRRLRGAATLQPEFLHSASNFLKYWIGNSVTLVCRPRKLPECKIKEIGKERVFNQSSLGQISFQRGIYHTSWRIRTKTRGTDHLDVLTEGYVFFSGLIFLLNFYLLFSLLIT